MNVLARLFLRELGPRICHAPEGDPPPGDPPPGDPPPGDPPPTPDKPDYVPDRLWKPENYVVEGKIDHEKLAADLGKWGTEAEKKIHTRRDHLRGEIIRELEEERDKGRPATADGYKVNLSQSVKDAKISLDENDPMLNWFRTVAHEAKMSQSDFDSVVDGYVQQVIANTPDADAVFKELGEFGEDRAKRVNGFMRTSLSADAYKHFSSIPVSVGTMKIFEELMGLAGEPDFNMDTGEPGEELGIDELRQMQLDDRYTGNKGKYDPAYVKKVQAGFKKYAARKDRGRV